MAVRPLAKHLLPAALLSTFAWVMACDGPTSIAVVTRATVPCQSLRGVSIMVTAAGGLEGPSTTTDRCEATPSDVSIGTLVVVPTGATDAKITIRVVAGVDRPVAECSAATSFAGCIVARRTLRFAPGKEIELPIDLRAECKDHGCDGLSTCVRGECRSAKVEDPSQCLGAACDESALDARPGGLTVAPNGPGTPGGPGSDGGVVVVLPDGGLLCGQSEKLCSGACVSAAEPAFGCDRSKCTPCAGSDSGNYACSAGLCVLLSCKPGFKRCGDACVPTDAAHGCDAAACAPCESGNGTASCNAGACAIACNNGYKACGGKCVGVTDPSYGCSPTACTNTNCPMPGPGATLVCNGTTCEVGACPAGTKNCNQKCVPTDVNNGCEAASCSACGASSACLGTPKVCTCVPEPATTTCMNKDCGPATNNCGQPVNCTLIKPACPGKTTCGGGAGGVNACGCTVTTNNCGACGAGTDNCGNAVSCPNTCVAPNTCNGAGNPNACGCTPITCYGQGICGYVDDGCGGQCYDGTGCGGGGD